MNTPSNIDIVFITPVLITPGNIAILVSFLMPVSN